MLKIGHILDAIDITDPRPSAHPALLKRAWTTIRFGERLEGLERNPVALGSALLKCSDFFRARSGLTDDHHILFPLAEIPRDGAAILKHLQWMVDSRRNPSTIKLILDAVNSAEPRTRRSRHEKDARDGKERPKKPINIELGRLARDLAASMAGPAPERELSEALLTGELQRVPDAALKIGTPTHTIIRRVKEMMVLWTLFDLQIIAARLFHAEWNALENGGVDNPDLITVQSVRVVMQQFLAAARELRAEFDSRKDGAELSKRVEEFLREHELLRHALRNAQAMGLTREDLKPGGISEKKRGQIERYLKFVADGAEVIMRGFDQSMTGESFTHLEYARLAGQTGKLKMAGRAFDTHKEIRATLEAKRSASTERFSMSTLTSLTYAVQRIVETIGGLPADDKILTNPRGAEDGLWRAPDQVRIRHQLFSIYRHAFVRDHRAFGGNAKSDRLENERYERDHAAEKADMHPLEVSGGGPGGQRSATMGVNIDPSAIPGIRDKTPRDLYADANLLVAFRGTQPAMPSGSYLDRMFESSLKKRLSGEEGETEKS